MSALCSRSGLRLYCCNEGMFKWFVKERSDLVMNGEVYGNAHILSAFVPYYKPWPSSLTADFEASSFQPPYNSFFFIICFNYLPFNLQGFVFLLTNQSARPNPFNTTNRHILHTCRQGGRAPSLGFCSHPGRICTPSVSQIWQWKGMWVHYESEPSTIWTSRKCQGDSPLPGLTAQLGCDKTDEANLHILFPSTPPPPASFQPQPPPPQPPQPPQPPHAGLWSLIASMEPVIRCRFPFNVWHCFRQCQPRWTSLVV